MEQLEKFVKYMHKVSSGVNIEDVYKKHSVAINEALQNNHQVATHDVKCVASPSGYVMVTIRNDTFKVSHRNIEIVGGVYKDRTLKRLLKIADFLRSESLINYYFCEYVDSDFDQKFDVFDINNDLCNINLPENKHTITFDEFKKRSTFAIMATSILLGNLSFDVNELTNSQFNKIYLDKSTITLSDDVRSINIKRDDLLPNVNVNTLKVFAILILNHKFHEQTKES